MDLRILFMFCLLNESSLNWKILFSSSRGVMIMISLRENSVWFLSAGVLEEPIISEEDFDFKIFDSLDLVLPSFSYWVFL